MITRGDWVVLAVVVGFLLALVLLDVVWVPGSREAHPVLWLFRGR